MHTSKIVQGEEGPEKEWKTSSPSPKSSEKSESPKARATRAHGRKIFSVQEEIIPAPPSPKTTKHKKKEEKNNNHKFIQDWKIGRLQGWGVILERESRGPESRGPEFLRDGIE